MNITYQHVVYHIQNEMQLAYFLLCIRMEWIEYLRYYELDRLEEYERIQVLVRS